MQSTEGKGQRDRLEALGCKLWHQSGPYHPGDLYKGAEYMLSGKQVAMVFYMVGQCAEAYSQSGAGPTDVCRVSPVEAQEILANPTATKEQIEWAHQQTKTLSGASSPEETGTCLVCPCGKAYRIIGGEIVELSKEQAEVMQEEAASSSQGAEPTEPQAWEQILKTGRLEPSAPEPPSQPKPYPHWPAICTCPLCCPAKWQTNRAVSGGGSTGERAEFEKWCPIKIIDEDCCTAPKARTLIDAYWTAWQARAALAEGSRTRHCAICAENRPATCDGRCELVAPVKGAEGETNGRHGL